MKCIDCGGKTGDALEVARDGKVILSGVMCGICQGWHVGRTMELEDTFNSLLSDGVSREEANRIIIDLIRSGEERTQ